MLGLGRSRKLQNVKEKYKELEMGQSESNVLEHQLEEWKLLNGYLNEIDMGYYQTLAITVSVLAVLVAIITSNKMEQNVLRGIFIVPYGLIALFSYLSYQFRITAILRGHLAFLEERMNEKLGEDVHMWNSALVEAYMAHNNVINNYMMIPMMFFIILLVIYSVFYTWMALENIPYAKVLFFIYWLLFLIGVVIVIPPFFKNETIRHETYDEKNVIEKYRKYKIQWLRKNTNKSVYISIIMGALNIILGFGMMYLFWCNSGTDTYGLKTLFDYYAATIGDAIFLSILISTGWYFCKLNKSRINGKESVFSIYGSIAAVVGTLIQISWLLSNDIELNWTIDRLHHFNYAGWYHACYFVAMFYVITKIVTKAIYINYSGVTKAKGCYILMWLSAMGYWFMHIIDDYLTNVNFYVWIMGSWVVFLIIFLICDRKHIRNANNQLGLYIGGLIGSVILMGGVVFFCKVGGLNLSVIELFRHINEILK